MTDRIVHFLLHVPKCAGTTVEDHFARHLGDAFLIAPRWASPMRNFLGNRYPGLTAVGMEEVRAVSGHSLSIGMKALFPGAEVRESVLLRDPLGFLLSFYNYRWTRHDQGWGPRPPEFARWYATQRRNPVSRFLLNRYFDQAVPAIYRLSSAARLAWLEDRLARFHFVGSHRRAGEMIAGISRELGLSDRVESRNVTPAPRLTAADLPADLHARILRDNALDQALFERWADRGWQGRPGPAPDLPVLDHATYLAGDIGSGIARKVIGLGGR